MLSNFRHVGYTARLGMVYCAGKRGRDYASDEGDSNGH